MYFFFFLEYCLSEDKSLECLVSWMLCRVYCSPNKVDDPFQPVRIHPLKILPRGGPYNSDVNNRTNFYQIYPFFGKIFFSFQFYWRYYNIKPFQLEVAEQPMEIILTIFFTTQFKILQHLLLIGGIPHCTTSCIHQLKTGLLLLLSMPCSIPTLSTWISANYSRQKNYLYENPSEQNLVSSSF